MEKTALIIVDIQNDYFPGGAFEQEGAEAAAEKASKILDTFRKKGMPVIHIRHETLNPATGFFLPGTDGAGIHQSVIPNDDETVILKNYPNSFRKTNLETTLRGLDVGKVVIIGMMTLMCIDATARAACDLGFEVTVLHDACATRALEFNGVKVPADHVQAAFLAALSLSYAKVETVDVFVGRVE
ncbi:cysteine hydrolase family protein [Maridesulfovibrio sp.]|uniref:cysteine hydrolase family protein n=1 Tax=Maridesulfovibrio sp. TaxID=2795000 RepID=UPI002A18AE15|nr:cysteine hydrolase family protein [Maridesulfovibrio sp.]